ncbi:MAG: cupin domain-containing protein, partial [Nakamurella sp.]
MSVRELARRSEVSPSHVSQVERGLASFSVRTLYNVASVLGLSMDTLFDDAPSTALDRAVAGGSQDRGIEAGSARSGTDDPLAANGTVLRVGSRPTIPLAGGTQWERLTARPESGAEFIEVVYPPVAPNGTRPKDFIQHSSREYGLVMSGTLTVQIGFELTQLRAGDSVVFDSVVPHRFWNETPDEVRAVWFIRDLPTSAADASEDQDPNA